jgi:hypothetical protein
MGDGEARRVAHVRHMSRGMPGCNQAVWLANNRAKAGGSPRWVGRAIGWLIALQGSIKPENCRYYSGKMTRDEQAR